MKQNDSHNAIKGPLLVDAINISTGGGLVLLKYLCDEIKSNQIDFFIVTDTNTNPINTDNYAVIHCANSLRARYGFFAKLEEQLKPSAVFCFGNFPPPLRLSCPVYTYFHRPALAKMNLHLASLSQKVSYRAKRLLLWAWRKNTDIFLFQSTVVQSNFLATYGNDISTRILPFYDVDEYDDLAVSTDRPEKIKNRFVYVSNDAPHKNHARLLEAWEELNERGVHPQLILTLPAGSRFEEKIGALNKAGCNVTNIGQVSHQEVLRETLKSEYVIFPSIAETLGLGLVEGFYLGCTVIAADLPYTREVVIPSFGFDPFSSSSIANTVIQAMKSSAAPATELVLANEINDLLGLLVRGT